MYIEMNSQTKSGIVIYTEISPPNISRLNKPKENVTSVILDDKPPEISLLNKQVEITKVIELSGDNPMYMCLTADNKQEQQVSLYKTIIF
jgi:hypothetical protein